MPLTQAHRDCVSRLGYFACLYSLVCMLLFDVWALLYPPPNKLSSEDLERLFGFFGFRFDRLVSLAAAVVFAAACLVHSGRKAGCVRNGVSQVPVLCNEFANMIGLTAHLLLAMDLLPVYRSPFGRIVPLARLGDWFSSRPLMAVLALLFDVQLPQDIVTICIHTALLQLSILAHTFASTTSNKSLANIYLGFSLATFPAIYIRLYQAHQRLHHFNRTHGDKSPHDPNQPVIQYFQTNIIKSVNALTLFGILFGFLRLAYILVKMK